MSLESGFIFLEGKKEGRRLVVVICALSLAWSFFVGQDTLKVAFETPRAKEMAFVKTLKKFDPGEYQVANFLCCIQTFLVEKNISIINFYGAWQKKGTPRFTGDTREGYDISLLEKIRPLYVLVKNDLDLSEYRYQKVFAELIGAVWRRDE